MLVAISPSKSTLNASFLGFYIYHQETIEFLLFPSLVNSLLVFRVFRPFWPMSTISHHHHHRRLLLLLFLLSISSFHACTDARFLGAIAQQPEKKFIPPNKNATKMSATRSKVGYGHSLAKQTRVREDDRRPPVVSSSSKAKDQLGLQVSGALRRPLSVDFSHCVAHCRKRHEQTLGFNADYSVPRTHPPVHN